MPPALIVDGVPLVVFLVLLVLFLPGAIRAWRTYAGVATRRQQDVTGQAPTPEGELAERIGALEVLGYRRIGETWTSTPSGSGFAWVLVSADEDTYALLAPGFRREVGLTGFYSTWRDGQWLGTLHPQGSRYQTGGLRIRLEKGTLAAAEASHRAEVAAMSVQRGGRRRITTLADVLELDAEYRTRFGGGELRIKLLWALAPTAIATLAIASILVSLLSGS
jgi:hypothetical protein